jgi:hypothetical protein
MTLTRVFAGVLVAGGLAVGAAAVGATSASAAPLPAPTDDIVVPLPPAGPNPGPPPAWAPPKPVDPLWANGQPVVWDQGWQHWGVWMNGAFIFTF